MRKLTVAGALGAAVALGLAAQPALAWNSWCDTEPPVTVLTPDGHRVTVNNWISVPVQDLHLLRSMEVSGAAYPGAEEGTSLVVIHVHTPRGGSQYVQITSSASRYQEVSSTRAGWGTDVYLFLTVPVD